MVKVEVMVIGCAKCKRLELNTQEAMRELNKEDDVERVEGLEEIKKRGVLTAPALFINGELKCKGRVPSVEEIKEMLKED